MALKHFPLAGLLLNPRSHQGRPKSLFPPPFKHGGVGRKNTKWQAISFSSEKRSLVAESRDILVTLAAHLKEKIDAGVVSPLDGYSRVLNKLATLERADAERARVWSRVQWAVNSWISAMRLSDGCG